MGSNLGEGQPLTANLISVVNLTTHTPSADLSSDEPSRWLLIKLGLPVISGSKHQQ